MMNNSPKWLAWLLLVCLTIGCAGNVLAEAPANASLSDFETLHPLMNLVARAAIVSQTEEINTILGEEGTLDPSFVNAFFNQGLTGDASLGVTEAMLTDTAAQGAFLSKIFAAKPPALSTIAKTEAPVDYIGFRPVTVNTATEAGEIQIVGEIYQAAKEITQMAEADYGEVQWLEPAIFTFKKDDAALNGFRLLGFSGGTELNMEQAMQGYFETILVEYVDTNLGFSLQYPSVFGDYEDGMLVEEENGVSGSLPDGSATFFARRSDNAEKADLESYITAVAGGIAGSKFTVNTDFQYGTVTYTSAEGNIVFGVYIVTEMYVYQAELSYKAALNEQFHMYTTYLENTFMVDEVSVG